MATYHPFILTIIIILIACLLTFTLFYLEYTLTAQTVYTSSSSSSDENNVLQLYSSFKKIPKPTPKQTSSPTPKPTQNSIQSSKFKTKKPILKGDKKYGPIPFRDKMECDSYHEKKGISFKQLWNWSPVHIFIGIWTVADSFEIRNLIRTLNIIQQSNLIEDKVDFKFIIENMNHGKAYYYWKWVAEYTEYADMQYDYIVKTDDDAFIHLQNLALNLRPLPRKHLYYGFENHDLFMYGELEILSIDQARMVGASSFNQTEWDGHEDRYLGYWLINHVNSTLMRISEDCLIFNDPRIRRRFSWRPWASPNSIVIHRLKEIPAWKSVIDLYIP
ncbi:hydroxyproline O-galactosyltransferase GALT3-like [Rhizophagus clarus]|uniref:Hydroxyproline O-galactosyltransferase GALT3-like n=1 Tax=Rhizophagus clarus TaxID=94130 RepID=A0A8H3M1D7_9GLOM|nr:hydroxyproline O-galactosyltransferase GALT3-like [Rhizophagus clarus]